MWIAGYGNGITGPNTPSVSGPTCGERVAKTRFDIEYQRWSAWHREGLATQDDMPKYPKANHTVVSEGQDTIAIIPGPKEVRERRAVLIAAAPEMLAAILDVIGSLREHSINCHLPLSGEIATLQAALDKANAPYPENPVSDSDDEV